MAPADTFSMETIWDTVFSIVDETRTENLVHTLATTYGQRVWFPIDKDGSNQLRAAWAFVNDTIKAYTGNEIYFTFRTEQLNLVAIKEGSDSNLAPIIIGGTIASRYTQGANGFASTAAAVLECANILHGFNLTNDVYFVLSNTIIGGYGAQDYGNLGFEYLLDELEEMGRRPAAVIWFNRLLYTTLDPNGDKIRMDYDYLAFPFDPIRWAKEIATQITTKSGTNDLVVSNVTVGGLWTESGAYSSCRRGIASISLGQYYDDYLWQTMEDSWDRWFYDYGNIAEAAGVAASFVATIGVLARGDAPVLTGSAGLAVNATFQTPMALTGQSYVNVTLAWGTNTTLDAQIRGPAGQLVYQRVENDNLIHISYLPPIRGSYTLRVENIGDNAATITYSFAHYQDLDWDTLDDYHEFIYGTDSLSSDTDSDFLSDDLEIVYGTHPRIQDSDLDGAFDGIEVQYGSDPLIQDSDGDTLFDGFEIANGLSPTDSDTDQDQLMDNIEIEIGTDPLSPDSDRDGLEDSEEVNLGTNPLSPDSDEDGLSDLFEALNALNPLSADTDQDGLSDSYEIEHCLMPFDPDTDRDGIPDAIDWAPREHWINIIPFAGLGVISVIILLVLLLKRRAYLRGG
ncbi:MAG: hypothetical protein ACFFD3_05515 [Candidatus Thorarchaeota archaeon]